MVFHKTGEATEKERSPTPFYFALGRAAKFLCTKQNLISTKEFVANIKWSDPVRILQNISLK